MHKELYLSHVCIRSQKKSEEKLDTFIEATVSSVWWIH